MWQVMASNFAIKWKDGKKEEKNRPKSRDMGRYIGSSNVWPWKNISGVKELYLIGC